MKDHTSPHLLVSRWVLITGLFLTACTVTPATEPAASEPSPTEPSLETSIPEADGEYPAILVPRGAAPILDGDLSAGEWDQALAMDMSNGGTVYFQQDGEHLYVGIEAEGLGYGSLCWQRGDQVWILHASAALGSAAYRPEGEEWRPVWDYEWCCRSTTDTSEREDLFAQESWMASISYLGEPGQMEYQIGWEGETRLAVIFQTGDSLATSFHWPQSLSDACLDLVMGSGELVNPAQFDLESWGIFAPADG